MLSRRNKFQFKPFGCTYFLNIVSCLPSFEILSANYLLTHFLKTFIYSRTSSEGNHPSFAKDNDIAAYSFLIALIIRILYFFFNKMSPVYLLDTTIIICCNLLQIQNEVRLHGRIKDGDDLIQRFLLYIYR